MAANLPAQYLPLFEGSNHAPVDFIPLQVEIVPAMGGGRRAEEKEIKRLDKFIAKMQAAQGLLARKPSLPVTININAAGLVEG